MFSKYLRPAHDKQYLEKHKTLFALLMIVQSSIRDGRQLRARHHSGFDHIYTPSAVLYTYLHPLTHHQRQPSRVFFYVADHLKNGDLSCRVNFTSWVMRYFHLYNRGQYRSDAMTHHWEDNLGTNAAPCYCRCVRHQPLEG